MDADCVKVEIQAAARDADTRKLVSGVGKRHKWLAADISTNRHLSCVASFILRHLGLDDYHQVILYPDSSVHSHLQNTPVNWGPNFDRALPLRDIHKIFGAPAKLHFLYHLITPEALSPPSKAPHVAGAGHDYSAAGGGGQQLLQPKQLDFRQELATIHSQQQYPQEMCEQPQHQLQQQPAFSSAYSQQQPHPPFAGHQSQQRNQQLCRPLLEAQQQMPLQHLQSNMQAAAAWSQQQQQPVTSHIDGNMCSAASGLGPQMYQQQVQLILRQPSLPTTHQEPQQPAVNMPHQTAAEQEQQQRQCPAMKWHQHHTACAHQQPVYFQHPGCQHPRSVTVVDGISSSCHGLDVRQPVQQRQQVPGHMMTSLAPMQLQGGHSCTATRGQTQQQAPSSQGFLAVCQPALQGRANIRPSFSHQSSQYSSGPAQLQADYQQQQQAHELGQPERIQFAQPEAGQVAAGLRRPAVGNVSGDLGAAALTNLGGQQPSVQQQRQPTPPLQAQQRPCVAPGAERAVPGVPGVAHTAHTAPVRLALRTADGQDIELPLMCSTENGRLVLLSHGNPPHSQASMPMAMPSAAQLLALLGVGGFGSVPASSNAAPVLQLGGSMAADSQQQEPDLYTHRPGAAGTQLQQPEAHVHDMQQQQQHQALQEAMDNMPGPKQHRGMAQQQCLWRQQHAVHSGQHQLQLHHQQLHQHVGPATSAPAAAAAVDDGGLSISAAPVSSAMVSGSAVHSSAAEGLQNVMCDHSRSAASPADVRSHCSSVSCGATGADGLHRHGSSRLAGGGINGCTLADVGGSATRSSLPRPDPQLSGGAADLEQQQQLAGRGKLQPRQLQMHQLPSKPPPNGQSQPQHQWQPQLQRISEHHDTAAAGSNSNGAAATASIGAEGVAADGTDIADTQDVSGELQLRLDDSGGDQQWLPEGHCDRAAAVDAEPAKHHSQGGSAIDNFHGDYDAAYSPQHLEEQDMDEQEEGEQRQQQPHTQQQQHGQRCMQMAMQHRLKGSQATQGQLCHQQSSQQQSEQQDSPGQGCSLQQPANSVCQQHQQQQGQLQLQGSMVAAACVGLGALDRSKAAKRPLVMSSYPSINSIGTSMPAFMQPPQKRAASGSKQRRSSVHSGQLPASMRLPAEDALLAVPSVIHQGSSFAGTCHHSSGRWHSRVEHTPLRPADLSGGSIFSVAELLRQQQQAAGAGAGSGVSISSKPGNTHVGGPRALKTQQHKQGPSVAAAAAPLQCQSAQLQQRESLPQLQQAMSQGPDPSSGPASNPGSTSLQGWCGATAAAAMSTGRAPSPLALMGADGADTAEEEEGVVGEGMTGVSALQQQVPGVAQQQEPASAAAMPGIDQTHHTDAQGEEPQQQQQRDSDQSHQWDGFQAAPPAATANGEPQCQTPETFIEQQQPQRVAGAVNAGNDSMLIDFEGLAAIMNGQSLMDVQQSSQVATLLQQPEPVRQPAADSGGGITMHEALKAAGIIPPSPPPGAQQLTAAGAQLHPVPMADVAAEHPEPQQQHDGACCPFGVPEGAAVADDGLLLCDTAGVVSPAEVPGDEAEQGPGVPSACPQIAIDQGLPAPAGMTTRRRAAALSGPSTSAAVSEGASAGDEHVSSDRQAARGQQRQGSSVSSKRKGAARGSKPAVKCRAPLPPVEQVMMSGLTPSSTGKRLSGHKSGSRVPLPPANALPAMTGSGATGARSSVEKALHNLVAAPAPQAAAAPGAGNGGLQRFTLPNGQTVYLAPPEPGAAAAAGQARPQPQLSLQQQALLRQQQAVGVPHLQLLQQQLLQQQALQLALLQQQQINGSVSIAGTHFTTSSAAPASQAPATSTAPVGASPAASSAAELAAAVNRLGPGLPVAGSTAPSGLITPGFLSPTGLLSPGAGGTGTAGGTVPGTGPTLDSLEALLADDFGFLSPEKGNPLAMFNSNSLAGMLSCLNSPSLQQFRQSPLPSGKRSRPASALQPQQPTAAATAEQAAGVATGTGGNTTADLQSLFRTFRDGAEAPGPASAAAAAAGGSKSSTPIGIRAPAADTGPGPADQQEIPAGVGDGHVSELYQFLVANGGGDSWLIPPASAAAGPATALSVGYQTAAAATASVTHEVTGNTRGIQRSAAQQADIAERAGDEQMTTTAAAATAGVRSKDHSSRAGGVTASNTRAVAGRRQQEVGAVEQQDTGSGFNPSKPFAALFPGSGS